MSIAILGIGPLTAVTKDRGSAPMDEGCPFRARCPFVLEGICDARTPPARRLDETLDHVAYCHHDVAAAT